MRRTLCIHFRKGRWIGIRLGNCSHFCSTLTCVARTFYFVLLAHMPSPLWLKTPRQVFTPRTSARSTGYVRLALDETPRGGKVERPLCKADILQWLQKSSESDVAWILSRLAETMPHLTSEVFHAKEDVAPCVAKTLFESKDDPLAGDPIIQFSTSEMYAVEGEDKTVRLIVIRIGNLQGTSEVYYETQDDSALSGRSYVATSGKLVFKPGEAALHIDVSIIESVLWDTTTEFKCRLKHEGIKGAVLGQYLHHARVRIINDNFFPTDQFQELTTPEKIAECKKWPLLFGYFSLVSNLPQVWTATLKYILIDCFHNMWYLLHLYMNIYILDFIIDKSSPESNVIFNSKWKALLVCAAFTVGAIAIGHALDYVRIGLPIVAPTRLFVQRALLRKFLNYKSIVHEGLHVGDVIQGIENDASELVLEGYINMLQVCSAVGKMICMLTFKVTAPLIFGKTIDLKTFSLLFVTPALTTIFLWIRQSTTTKVLEDREKAAGDAEDENNAMTRVFSLVLDYNLRSQCESRLVERRHQLALAIKQAAQTLLNNTYFSKWCQSLVIAMWLVYGGFGVLNGRLTIGFFVTNLQLLNTAGALFLQLDGHIISLMQTFPALENVTTLMNYPVDVAERRDQKRAQWSATEKYYTKAQHWRNENGATCLAIDMMPIVLNFQRPFKFEGKCQELNFKGRVEVQQGQLVAIVGSMGNGKATLLRLISGAVLPTTDSRESPVTVPSHLRIASVADDPIFFNGTLYDNLAMGLDVNSPDVTRRRIKSICKRVTRSNTITDYLDRQEELAWRDVFSAGQCKALCIARALIQNCEVLCIHKPLARMTNDDAQGTMLALHDHVENKGLELTSDLAKRRPRTVFVSAATDRAVHEANNVIKVDALSGMELLSNSK